jgi:hypothetical protein
MVSFSARFWSRFLHLSGLLERVGWGVGGRSTHSRPLPSQYSTTQIRGYMSALRVGFEPTIPFFDRLWPTLTHWKLLHRSQSSPHTSTRTALSTECLHYLASSGKNWLFPVSLNCLCLNVEDSSYSSNLLGNCNVISCIKQVKWCGGQTSAYRLCVETLKRVFDKCIVRMWSGLNIIGVGASGTLTTSI